jgi:aromatic-L-amino-acid/L-tryptophan decarboxylase
LGDVRTLVRRVVVSGRAWVAPATLEGQDVVRICATNGETAIEDVDALVAALNAKY